MVISNKKRTLLFVLCAMLSCASSAFSQATDSDGDGVPNTSDFCSNTPIGTTVNAYGCPVSITTCDYTSSSFSANVVGVAPTNTRYLLVNSATGIIEQITSIPAFTGLTGTNTYMVLAYSYVAPATGLVVGSQLSAVSANCQDYSSALVVKVCVPVILPTISINDASLNETGTSATLTLTLSSAQTSAVSVNYATANNTAILGSDYISSTGTVTFAAGETSKTIIIPLVDDAINESTESFNVNLTSATGATISDNQGVVTIFDNDPIVTDSDGDGVPNTSDFCSNTPIGTVVNAYGCPVSIATCDYNTSSVTFNSETAPIGKETRYILADALDGKIIQITASPTFIGLTGTKTYMVLAYSYANDGTLVNLTTSNYINQVSAACADWSNALVVKICSPFIGGGNCDFTTSTITLTNTTAPSGATTQYVLVNSSGTIIKVANTPTFSGLSGMNTYNAYAISYTSPISNLSIGNNFSNVSGTCYDWSSPLSIKVCVCKPNICLPITVSQIK